MRQLLRTVHLFPSSPPKNIFDTKIHLYVQKKKLFQLSGLQTSEAALKKKKEKRFKLSSYYIHECETYIFYRSQHKHHKLRVLESGTSSGCGGREKERADLLCNGCHVCNCVSLAQTRAQPWPAHLQARHLIVYPFISWLLSLIFLWPDEDRRCALTPNSDWTAPHPRYQPAPLWPWWPRSDHRGARRSSRCCCSACASGSLLQGAPCPPACAASAPWSAAPPALPQTPAGVRSADVAAQWTWTTAAKHIVSILIVKFFSQGPSIIHLPI